MGAGKSGDGAVRYPAYQAAKDEMEKISPAFAAIDAWISESSRALSRKLYPLPRGWKWSFGSEIVEKYGIYTTTVHAKPEQIVGFCCDECWEKHSA